MWPPRKPSGLGARAASGWCRLRLAGLICTLALAEEDLGGKGVSSLKARSIDDATLLIQGIPLADPAATIANAPYLTQPSGRYLARHRMIVGARRTRNARKQAPVAGEPQPVAPGPAGAGAVELPKSPEWWEARVRELVEAVNRVDNATGQETAEWWEARARELREAQQQVKRLTWQRKRDEHLKALADGEESRAAKRRDFEAWHTAMRSEREAGAERFRQMRRHAADLARWRVEDQQAMQDWLGAQMNVTVRDSQGKELHFHFRHAAPLKVLMVYVAGKLGVKPDQANFTFQGRRLEPKATADDIGLPDHGVVDVNESFPVKDGSEEEDLDEIGKIHLVAKNPKGRESHVWMSSAARLQLLMGLTCRRLQIRQKEVRFMFNGTRLNSSDTPESVGLVDGDVVQVEPDPVYIEAQRRAAEEAKGRADAKQRAQEDRERRLQESRERKRQTALDWQERRFMQEVHSAERLAQKERALKAQEEAKLQKIQAAERKRLEQAKAAEVAAKAEEATRAKFGSFVYLVVRDQRGKELRVKFRTGLPMRVLLSLARKKWGLEQAEVSFTHAGIEVKPETSAEALGLKDMDVIEAKVAPDATAHLVAEQRARLRARALPRTSTRREAKRAKQPQDWLVVDVDPDMHSDA